MTTKEQERKALEQIRKIVASLGEDSYVGTAFEGCFEIAEENIANDFACSMKQRWETAEAACDKRRDQVHQLEEKVEITRKELELAKTTMQQEAERARHFVEKYQGMKNLADEQERARVEVIGQLEAIKDQMADKDEEIIRLKAKLYDLMMASK